MRTNHAGVTETAHLRTDLEKYQRAYDHVFNKAKCPCEECEEARSGKQESVKVTKE